MVFFYSEMIVFIKLLATSTRLILAIFFRLFTKLWNFPTGDIFLGIYNLMAFLLGSTCKDKQITARPCSSIAAEFAPLLSIKGVTIPIESFTYSF
jgi:hypothetical protein